MSLLGQRPPLACAGGGFVLPTPVGTVRFGLGAFNTLEEVDAAVAAVGGLAREAR
jgi:selenocysteine lyase/cysteine desulfurase